MATLQAPSRCFFLLILATIINSYVTTGASAITVGPSEFCHVTDGAFTTCPGGKQEWSDIAPAVFSESQSYLYADQADLDPTIGTPDGPYDTFVLMYDECGRTTPLRPNEYFLVSFKTVELEEGVEVLEQYVVHLFGDGTIIFLENGEVEDEGGEIRVSEIAGQRGAVGFGPSPNCAQDHLIAEFQITLTATGVQIDGGYSPDPIFWSSDPPPCTVTISPEPANMNVGQLAQFTATATGVSKPTYQWTVDGDIIKEYSESVDGAWGTMPMQETDFQNSTIAFYWKPDPSQRYPSNAGVVPRRVAVTVTDGDQTCQDEIMVNVERNESDISRQAEDYYDSNHGGIVLRQHSGWHMVNSFRAPGYSGSLFFDFHREYISRFNSWRAEFGYPSLSVWDPASSGPPTDPSSNHGARDGSYTPQPRPSWFTTAGGGGARPPNILPCEGGTSGETRLADFPADRQLLGCAVTSPWHNGVHVQIGEDMAEARTAPQDPVFWQWHNYVDGVSQARLGLTPATVIYQIPFRFFAFIAEIPSVSVTFSEPMTGVTADDLLVNGSAATSVTGSGAGPYAFSGYASPPLGLVMVQVLAGAIVDDDGEAFQGTSWSHTLIDPNGDQDSDGANDGEEASVFLTDPTNPDTDGDGLPDGFETTNACLDPHMDQANPEDMEGNPMPGDDDADDDGATDAQELALGTDPCSPPPSAHIITNGLVQLGVNDEGHLNVPGGAPSSGTGTTFVGLRFVPTGAEGTAPGCLCEGWGAADAISGVTGYANEEVDGIVNLALVEYQSDISNAISKTRIGSTFEVIHNYHPSGSPNLYEATVTIKNIGSTDVDARYRRVMDWDIEPTAFEEYVSIVTVQGAVAAGNVLFSSDDGFASANPLAGPTSIAFVGDAIDNGPSDHGALFDFGFGTLAPGDSVQFKIFYGAAASESEALDALAVVRAEVYSLGQPSTPDGPNLGMPNTFVFAFANVGGTALFQDEDLDGVRDDLDNCPGIANANQADANLNGIGDACEFANSDHATAGFLQANADGSSLVEPEPISVAEEPTLLEQLTRIVEFRVEAGLTDSAEELTENLVESLVEIGLVPPDEADDLIDAVLSQLGSEITIDIRPRACPNPLNRTAGGVIPVAILGAADLDVADILRESVRLVGVSPLRAEVQDVATPVQRTDPCDCTRAGADGFPDLVLKFEARAIYDALGRPASGNIVAELTATLTQEAGGGAIRGSDCFKIVPDSRSKNESSPVEFALRISGGNPLRDTRALGFSYDIPAPGADVSISVYDIAGRRVAMILDGHVQAGRHTGAYDGTDFVGLASGVYFLRLEASGVRLTERVVLLK